MVPWRVGIKPFVVKIGWSIRAPERHRSSAARPTTAFPAASPPIWGAKAPFLPSADPRARALCYSLKARNRFCFSHVWKW